MFLIRETESVLFASKADKKHCESNQVLFACDEEPDYCDVEEFIHEIRIPEIIQKLDVFFSDNYMSYTKKTPDDQYTTFNVEIGQYSQGYFEARTYEYEVIEVTCHKNIKEVLKYE